MNVHTGKKTQTGTSATGPGFHSHHLPRIENSRTPYSDIFIRPIPYKNYKLIFFKVFKPTVQTRNLDS